MEQLKIFIIIHFRVMSNFVIFKQKIRNCDTSRARLEANQVHLSRQIQREVKENAALTQEGWEQINYILFIDGLLQGACP